MKFNSLENVFKSDIGIITDRKHLAAPSLLFKKILDHVDNKIAILLTDKDGESSEVIISSTSLYDLHLWIIWQNLSEIIGEGINLFDIENSFLLSLIPHKRKIFVLKEMSIDAIESAGKALEVSFLAWLIISIPIC